MRRDRSHGRMTFALAAAALVLLCVAPSRAAEPDPATTEAKAAYDRGAAAYERGDMATAARELARADALLPNPVALASALRAALEGDEPVLGMELAARASTRSEETSVAELVRAARARFGSRVGKLRVICPGPCRVAVDGAPFEANEERFVRAGPHVVAIEQGTTREEIRADVPAGAAVTATPKPPAEATKAADRSGGLSPVWFFVGLGATAVSGAVLTASSLQTKGLHDDFVARGCPGPAAPRDCRGIASDGEGAQLRTNVLVGVTAVLGAATITLGALSLGRRDAPTAAQLSFETLPGGGVAKVSVSLP
ncbi:hypothetical protein [Polyangium fumosum]|uniref:Tetratricopeptide repeat protein n=1 Tax=Polyangium fumosum TaxID=889272 RepID=A0A4U1JCS3_9BACT|nr:hypothetical protein [Polyangium fumosum]TKD08439.1 hypothetical protein E8A74_16120 [Polyangium fumosum]